MTSLSSRFDPAEHSKKIGCSFYSEKSASQCGEPDVQGSNALSVNPVQRASVD
jgi:hypothetical protein